MNDKHHQATGAATISSTLTPVKPIRITSVRLHLSAVGGAAENFTITINSATAPAYDTLIFSQDMTAVQDILWIPERPIPIVNNDPIDFAYTNTNTRTYGLEVTYEV